MHPALRKGTLFFYKNTPHFPLFFTKKHPPPFHFLLQACCQCIVIYCSASNTSSLCMQTRGTLMQGLRLITSQHCMRAAAMTEWAELIPHGTINCHSRSLTVWLIQDKLCIWHKNRSFRRHSSQHITWVRSTEVWFFCTMSSLETECPRISPFLQTRET